MAADTLVLMTEQRANTAGEAGPAARHDEQNEFRFLASDAASVGRKAPLPEVRRLQVSVSDGRALSALRYLPPTAPGAAAEALRYVCLLYTSRCV